MKSKYLIHWFATNLDFQHSKVEALPIGISNSKTRYGFGDPKVLSSLVTPESEIFHAKSEKTVGANKTNSPTALTLK